MNGPSLYFLESNYPNIDPSFFFRSYVHNHCVYPSSPAPSIVKAVNMTTTKDPTIITPLKYIKSSISGLDASDILDLKTHLDSLFPGSGPVDVAFLSDPDVEPGDIP